ncbi:anthrone oxygenase family protein [Lentzea flava]|uniref:Membrane protein n=1 Tax=Lentzea flava TaxID=103732 RepID=A0ABQ2VAP3_9PSEU|nr:anthrone oxygenase family protein [Lentzea flava]MCP2204236.1 putative membrane protein [Lentzea flava]GGU75648.1 membrane protein [Lentzea flava]
MGTITLIAAAASGLMAGLFFSFSTAVMPGLADLPAEHARSAMRRINVRIQNPVFLLVFTGNVILCGIEVFQGRIGGGLLYIVGSFLLTMFVNVPMNNRLERADDTYWPEYLRKWTIWNHVRGLACLASMITLLLGF